MLTPGLVPRGGPHHAVYAPTLWVGCRGRPFISGNEATGLVLSFTPGHNEPGVHRGVYSERTEHHGRRDQSIRQ